MTGGLAVTEDPTEAHGGPEENLADEESEEYGEIFGFSIVESGQAEIKSGFSARFVWSIIPKSNTSVPACGRQKYEEKV